MPQVKLPNGDVGVFPDDMPASEIEAVLQRQFPPDTRNALEKFGAGVRSGAAHMVKGAGEFAEQAVSTHPVGALVVKAGQAVRQALTPVGLEGALSPEELARLKSEADTGWGTAGEVAANLVGTAIPAARVFKLTAGANPTLWRGIAAGAASGAAPAAVITPGDVGERAQAAAMDAAGGAAGEIGGRVLKKALTGLVKPSRAAETLMEQGITPTVGQGAESSMARGLEDLAAGIPGFSGFIRKGQKRAQTEAQRILAGRADPTDLLAPGAKPLWETLPENPTSREIVKGLSARTSAAWEAAVAKVAPVGVTGELHSSLSGLGSDLPEEVGAAFNKLVAKHLSNKSVLTGKELNTLQSDIGQFARTMAGSERGIDRHAAEELFNIQSKVRDGLLGGATKELNDAYRNFLLQQKAGSYVGTEQAYTPRVFQRALKSVGGANAMARGDALHSTERAAANLPQTQDIVDAAQILKSSPKGGMSTALGSGVASAGLLLGHAPETIAAAIAAAIGSTPWGAKAAFGKYGWQKTLADTIKAYRPAPAITGAALAEQQRPKALNEYR